MSKINFFDGEISKSDVTSALSRMLVIVLSILFAAFIFSLFQSSSTSYDTQINELAYKANDESISDSVRSSYLEKLTYLNAEREANSFWQSLLQTCMMLFVFTIAASLISYAYTKIRWTSSKVNEAGFQQTINMLEMRIKAVIAIFTTTLVSGSIIYLAQNL